MRGWERAVLTLGGLGLLGIAAPRYLWFTRRALPADSVLSTLRSEEGLGLAVAHLARGHDRLIVVAHGLLKTMNNPGIVRFIEMLGAQFDVLAFDLPGHGLSAGACTLDFADAARHLTRVIDFGRQSGYRRVGVVGYSLGAAAAILAAAQGANVDAVVSVSCPAGPRPSTSPRVHWPTWPWRWWARLMGTRIAPTVGVSTWPIELVNKVSPHSPPDRTRWSGYSGASGCLPSPLCRGQATQRVCVRALGAPRLADSLGESGDHLAGPAGALGRGSARLMLATGLHIAGPEWCEVRREL